MSRPSRIPLTRTPRTPGAAPHLVHDLRRGPNAQTAAQVGGRAHTHTVVVVYDTVVLYIYIVLRG